MLTNGVCSVFRPGENGILAVGVYACMWQGGTKKEIRKAEEKKHDTATVYVADVDADICTGDFIFFGELAAVPDDREIYNAMTVHEIKLRNYGSWGMRHLQLEVN